MGEGCGGSVSAGVTPAAAEQLRRARARIATPERWTQGTLVRLREAPSHPRAIWCDGACLCVDGALLFALDGMRGGGASLCLSLAARARGFETASKMNDHPSTTHADVLALLDEAIALAESLAQEPS